MPKPRVRGCQSQVSQAVTVQCSLIFDNLIAFSVDALCWRRELGD